MLVVLRFAPAMKCTYCDHQCIRKDFYKNKQHFIGNLASDISRIFINKKRFTDGNEKIIAQ
jgi:hypothetical protein